MSDLSDKIRMEFKRADDIRDEGLMTPGDIVRTDDIIYGKNDLWQRLDVYRPADKVGELLPVIVSFHGGGWVYGDKERYQYYCMSLAQMGFAVVNFTYRLAPEFKFPSSMIDFNLVLKWIMDNSLDYGFDLNNIFAVGDSAGAHSLAMYANIATNREYARLFSVYAETDKDQEIFVTIDSDGFHVPLGIELRALGLNCGQYQMNPDDSDVTKELAELYLPAGEYEMVDIPLYITPDYPAVFMMTSNHDFLKKEIGPMIESLLANGIDFLVRHCSYEGKELFHVFHCNMKSDEARRFNREQIAFFRGYLK